MYHTCHSLNNILNNCISTAVQVKLWLYLHLRYEMTETCERDPRFHRRRRHCWNTLNKKFCVTLFSILIKRHQLILTLDCCWGDAYTIFTCADFLCMWRHNFCPMMYLHTSKRWPIESTLVEGVVKNHLSAVAICIHKRAELCYFPGVYAHILAGTVKW